METILLKMTCFMKKYFSKKLIHCLVNISMENILLKLTFFLMKTIIQKTDPLIVL